MIVHRIDSQRGGASAEHIAVVVIVAAVIAGLIAVGVPGTVQETGAVAVDCLFEIGCELPDGEDGALAGGGEGGTGDGTGSEGGTGEGGTGDGTGGSDGGTGDGTGSDGGTGEGGTGDGTGGSDGGTGEGGTGEGGTGDGTGGQGATDGGEGGTDVNDSDDTTGEDASGDPPRNENETGAGGDDSTDTTSEDADPVNTLTGAFIERTTDLALAGRGPAVWFGRSYVSTDDAVGDLGPGWQHNFEARVAVSSRAVALVGETAQRSVYRRDRDGNLTPAPGVHTALREIDGGWEAIRRDGTRLLFDADGQLARVTDRLGMELIVSRQGGRISEVTGHSGQRLTFEHEGDRLVRVVDSAGRATQMTYDARGRLATATAPTGDTFAYTYDRADRLVEVVDGNGDVMVANTYDDRSRVVAQVEGGLETWMFDYALDGDEQITTITDPAGGERVYHYRNRVLIAVTDALGNTTRMGYDDDLNVAVVTDPLAHTTRFSYDAAGRVTSVTPPAPFDVPSRFEYDRTGNLIVFTDAEGATTRFAYDGDSNLVAITDPGGATTTIGYGPRRGLPTEIELPDGSVWEFTYDEYGRVTSERSPEGRGVRMRYDETGDLIEVRALGEAAPGAWVFAWDDAGRLVSTSDPTGATSSFSYDGVGQVTSMTGPNGDTTAYTYDPLYRLTAVTGADGAQTTYRWRDGRLVARVAPTGGETSYRYDDAGRLTAVTSPTGATWRYGYDAAGNLTTVREPAGTTTSVAHTALGAPSTVEVVGDTTVNLVYDTVGRLLAMHDDLGRHDYVYDRLGRLVEIGLDGQTTHVYAYDQVGNLVAREVAGLDPVEFDHDADGYPVAVRSAGLTFDHRYDGLGRLVEETASNGVTTTTAYDRSSRVSRILARDAQGRTVDAHVYAYDDAGFPRGHRTVSEETRYAYDAQGRLTEAVTLSRGTGETVDSLRYDYDEAGRRSAVETLEGITTYSYDEADRLVATDGPHGRVEYRYDAAGNRTHAGDTIIEYGPLGRVDAVQHADGSRIDYLHDGAGVRRAAVADDGTRTDYLWDLAAPNYPLLGIDGPDGLERYVTGPGGGLLAAQPAGHDQPLTVHTDVLGSISALTAIDGLSVGAFAYTPFGQQREVAGDAGVLSAGFTGELHDPVSELVHLRLRDYDPVTGQFTALDPAPQDAFAPYTTPYHYGHNAPTVYTDPSGACPWCVVTAAVGAAVNVGLEVGGSLVRGERPSVGNIVGAAIEGAVVGAVAGTGVGLVGVVAAGVGANAANQVARHSINRTWDSFDPVSSTIELTMAGGFAAAGKGLSNQLTRSPTVGGRTIAPSVNPADPRAMFRMNALINSNFAFRQQVFMLPVHHIRGTAKR